MKVLFVSNLFPDSASPGRGQVNATLLQRLADHGEIRVVSPRPSLPFTRWRVTCREEDRIFQPRYVRTLYLPKLGGLGNHHLMVHALRKPIRQLRRAFPFDVILSAWVYPDACAVETLSRDLGVPVVAIAQGSDVHGYLQMPLRRRAIVCALSRSAATITRSEDLARRLREAGVPPAKLYPIYNGVNTAIFRPGDTQEARRDLGLPGNTRVILFVGNLLPVKNPLAMVAAHAELCRRSGQACELVIVGTGPLESRVSRLAQAGGFGAHVRLVGYQTLRQVARYMQAADVLCVPSKNEGVPNVMLEAFACGLRSVATRVGGIPEVLSKHFLGRLVRDADINLLADALGQTLAEAPQTDAILHHARQFSWGRTAEAYLSVLEDACTSRDRSA